jgi:4-hydroxy-tetrahydrodipicolinate synthase|tara:strand:- start:2825 stop:3712 length:888 start_codon:yes stop_codon:yes gene_type:complete
MSEDFRGVFAASMSVLKADLSLDIEATISHAKKNLDENGVGSAFFGSTGAGQLIGIRMKKEFISELSKEKFKEKILIGTSSNSLYDTIDLMQHSIKKGLKNFLIMNVAYYKNEDSGVYDFFKNIIKAAPESKIILYNFSKLSGYEFSSDVTKKLIKDFPNIVGMKDSTGNLWENFKAKNFSMFVGSEKKLLDNLKIGGAGCISATTNFTGSLAKKVYDDFKKKGASSENEKLKAIRSAFDETGNLISALHTLKSLENPSYSNLLPPLELLNKNKKDELIKKLKGLGVLNNKNIAA